MLASGCTASRKHTLVCIKKRPLERRSWCHSDCSPSPTLDIFAIPFIPQFKRPLHAHHSHFTMNNQRHFKIFSASVEKWKSPCGLPGLVSASSRLLRSCLSILKNRKLGWKRLLSKTEQVAGLAVSLRNVQETRTFSCTQMSLHSSVSYLNQFQG